MASHATTSNAAPACQARRKRLIPYWDRFLDAQRARQPGLARMPAFLESLHVVGMRQA